MSKDIYAKLRILSCHYFFHMSKVYPKAVSDLIKEYKSLKYA